jgi:hypothetical protein
MLECAREFQRHQLRISRQYFCIEGQMWVQVGNQPSQPISIGTVTEEIRQFLGGSDLGVTGRPHFTPLDHIAAQALT